jgi:hypothetical protein
VTRSYISKLNEIKIIFNLNKRASLIAAIIAIGLINPVHSTAVNSCKKNYRSRQEK